MTKKIKIIIIAVLIVVVAAVGVFLVLANPTKPDNVSEVTNGGLSEATNGELNVQLGLEKSNYSIGETITFKSYIKNKTAESKKYTFNSTCTEGTIYINQMPTQLIKACGQASTDVDLVPYQTISYSYPFTLVDNFSGDVSSDYIEYEGELKLPPGQYQAVLKWQGFDSNPLTFSIE